MDGQFYLEYVDKFLEKIKADGGITLGSAKIGSAAEQPNYDAPPGSVMFNSEADYGKPVGWVSLGKTKWAPFSIIS
jgi:hypothetical protein